MDKRTLYETLEVSENASQEIIEKAYKTLAKKYHPDLQSETNKKNSEMMMKKINEAYEILGDKDKRQAYDRELQADRERIKQEEIAKQREKIYNEYNEKNKRNANDNNYQLNKEHSYQENDENNNENYNHNQNYYDSYENMVQDTENRTEELKRRTKEQEEINKQYQNAYEDYLRSLGYRIKHKWTKENYRDFFITLGIIIIIVFVLWVFPPTHNAMVDFYEQNPIFKAIVNVIIGIIKGIWNAIVSLFS